MAIKEIAGLNRVSKWKKMGELKYKQLPGILYFSNLYKSIAATDPLPRPEIYPVVNYDSKCY